MTVKETLVNHAVPEAVLRYYSDRTMLNSFMSCTNEQLRKYGYRLYTFIRFGRSILSEMLDRCIPCNVYAVNIRIDKENENYNSFIVVEHHTDTSSHMWCVDISDDDGNLDLNIKHDVFPFLVTDAIPIQFAKYMAQTVKLINVHTLKEFDVCLSDIRDLLRQKGDRNQ